MTNNQQPDRRGNHLRAWRELRGLTQAQLAAIVGTQGSVISLLESGDRALSNKWLLRLASALGTRPAFLLDYDPAYVDVALLEVLGSQPGIGVRSERKAGMRQDPYETHDPHVDPGYDIPEIWWKIPDEDKPAALAALKALIPRH